jgi:hypothetical protein
MYFLELEATQDVQRPNFHSLAIKSKGNIGIGDKNIHVSNNNQICKFISQLNVT